jgi:hypothetical protein
MPVLRRLFCNIEKHDRDYGTDGYGKDEDQPRQRGLSNAFDHLNPPLVPLSDYFSS